MIKKNYKDFVQDGNIEYGWLKKLSIMSYIVSKHILKKLFCRGPFIEFVKKMNEKNPKALRGKYKKFDIWENIDKKKTFGEFLRKLKFYTALKKSKESHSKIHGVLKNYYLRKYL